jgi:hypothetical protein
MKYKCLNPDCHHLWETRGEYIKNLRCPRCHKSYAVEEEVFETAVLAQMALLETLPPNLPAPPDVVVTVGNTKARVIRKLFPLLPFSAFQVIDEEAGRRIRQARQLPGQSP